MMDNLDFQLDFECLELRNSLIFDYLWIPEEVPLDLLSLEAPLDSGFWILLLVELTLDASKCGVWILDSGFWMVRR